MKTVKFLILLLVVTAGLLIFTKEPCHQVKIEEYLYTTLDSSQTVMIWVYKTSGGDMSSINIQNVGWTVCRESLQPYIDQEKLSNSKTK